MPSAAKVHPPLVRALLQPESRSRDQGQISAQLLPEDPTVLEFSGLLPFKGTLGLHPDETVAAPQLSRAGFRAMQ